MREVLGLSMQFNRYVMYRKNKLCTIILHLLVLNLVFYRAINPVSIIPRSLLSIEINQFEFGKVFL